MTQHETIDTDPETLVIFAHDITKLACAQHITIRACDASFIDLITLVDPATLSCLLAGSIAVPETQLTVPWNGAIDGQLQIVAVDSQSIFSCPKRIDLETVVETAAAAAAAAAAVHRRPTDRDRWYDAVVNDYPGQDAALAQLLDIIWDQYGQRASVGVVVSGPDADLFVDAVGRHSGVPVRLVSVCDLFGSRRGQAERRLDAAFGSAPSLVVVRDLDLLQNSAQGERLRLRLQQLLDDIQLGDDIVFVLAPIQGSASTLPASLRRSLRLDHLVALRALDLAGRRAVLASIVDGPFASIAEHAHGFGPGDIRRLCSEAAFVAMGRDDRVRLADLHDALGRIRPSCLDDRLRPLRPSRPLSALAGIDDVIARLRAAIMRPLRDQESYRRLGIRAPRGVLLFGPSGVGKTTLALGIAAEADAVVFEARGCDLISAVVGESEKAIRDLFQRARALAPAVVVLDQVETLAPRRDRDQNRTYDRVLSCLLTELDGVTSRASNAPLVFVIGTTSLRDRMDDAVLRPGRFDEQIEIGLPDVDGRRAILYACCKAMPMGDDVDLDELARATSGSSGADLQGICIDAAMNALRRDLHSAIVTADDFRSAIPIQSARKNGS